MKQKFMKKALAVALSTAMVFSASSVAGMQSASAAAKFVGLNTTFKTLKVGQKDYKLRLVNNTQNWKIKKVSTSNKKVATVYGKKASYVLLKGKSEGRATIKVSLKTTVRRKNNTKVLKCKVKVVAAGTTTPTPTPTPTPDPTPTPSQTTKVVATQADLTAALADSTLKAITVKTDSQASFTIPAGSHTGVDLTVDAPNAEVTNSGVFKSITIAAIKDSTWTENAVGNTFKVDALKARIVVGANASVTGVSVTKANADVAIVVNGKLASVTISAKAKLALSGSATENVAVKIQAAGSELTAELPVTVEASADATIDLKAKAEKSTVKITNAAATVTVKNNTAATIAITKADNKTQNVSPKGSATIKPSTSGTSGGYVNNGGGSSWIGGGSSGGSSSGGSGSGGNNSGGSGSGGNNDPSTPDTKTVNVYTQDDLNKALADDSVTKINIFSRKDGDTGADEDEITIKEGTYEATDLVVDAPKKSITNNAKFRNIEIKNIAPETWHENSSHYNHLTVSAPNPHIIVGKNAMVGGISFAGEKELTKVSLMIEGTVDVVSFGTKVKNTVINVASGAIADNVTFGEGAKDSNISMNVEGSVSFVNCDAANANLDLVVAASGATIDNVYVRNETAVAIKAKEGVTVAPVHVELKAEKAELTTAVPVDVLTTIDNTVVVLKASAAGSTITATEDVAEIGISTETEVILKKDGSEDKTVPKGEQGNLNVETGGVTPVPVKGVKLNITELSMLTTDIEKGKATKELTVSKNPAYASGDMDAITWKSSDETVAIVEEGEPDLPTVTLKGLKEGTATITVKVSIDGTSYDTSCTVTITKPDTTVDTSTGDDNTGLKDAAVTIATQTVTTGSATSDVKSPASFTLTGIKATATVDGASADLEISSVEAENTEILSVAGSDPYTFTINGDANKKADTFNVIVTAKDKDKKYTVTAKVPVEITEVRGQGNGYSIKIGTISIQ